MAHLRRPTITSSLILFSIETTENFAPNHHLTKQWGVLNFSLGPDTSYLGPVALRNRWGSCSRDLEGSGPKVLYIYIFSFPMYPTSFTNPSRCELNSRFVKIYNNYAFFGEIEFEHKVRRPVLVKYFCMRDYVNKLILKTSYFDTSPLRGKSLN